jgi:hypothetical protein
MGKEKWFFLLECGDRKIFRIRRRSGGWLASAVRFRGEIFETIDGRRVKTAANWDFRTQEEAIAWALADGAAPPIRSD